METQTPSDTPRKLVAIDSGRKRRPTSTRGPLPPSNGGQSTPHKKFRDSFVAMFRRRRSVRRIARFYEVPEHAVENAILDELEKRAA